MKKKKENKRMLTLDRPNHFKLKKVLGLRLNKYFLGTLDKKYVYLINLKNFIIKRHLYKKQTKNPKHPPNKNKIKIQIQPIYLTMNFYKHF